MESIADERFIKGPWGRGLSDFSKCTTNQTVSLTCTPLLKCWSCESDNSEDCFREKNMKELDCNQNTIQCYTLKYTDTGGEKTVRSCGSSIASNNHNTCTAEKAAAGCGKNGRVCFCRQCFGRLCNASPLYKVANMQSKTAVGALQSLAVLMEDLTTLLRIGMFDISVLRSTNETAADNSTISKNYRQYFSWNWNII